MKINKLLTAGNMVVREHGGQYRTRSKISLNIFSYLGPGH